MSLREQLIIDEGLRLHRYKCTAGKNTIGVGHNLDDNPLTAAEVAIIGSAFPEVITREQAMMILDRDIEEVSADVVQHIPWTRAALPQVRDVLNNMAFNMGVYGVLKFKLTLKAIKEGRYAEAADMMLDSKWARQVGDRAKRLAAVIASLA